MTETQPTIPADQLPALLKRQKKQRNKYHTATVTGEDGKQHWIEVDGIKFQSQAEAERWQTLRLLEHQGEIRNLKRQVRHKLLIETVYVSDFEFFEKDGTLVCEDVKGYATREYKRKAREMKRQLGIEVREIRA